jgi:hypothetical protein
MLALPLLRPDVVPSLYKQENSPAGISKRQFQHAATKLYPEAMYRTLRISSATQTSFLDIPVTSQLRPVIIQNQVDTQISPLIPSGETVNISVDTQTVQATDLVSTEDKGTELDTDMLQQVTDTIQITEPSQTGSLLLTSVEIQTEELLTVTEVFQTDILKELQISVSSQTISEEMCIKEEISKELGMSVSTQTILLETQTISTETECAEVTSIGMQTEETLEKSFVASSNLKTSSEIQKTIIDSTHQPSQLEPHLSLPVSSNVSKFSAEDDHSAPLPTVMVESDISVEDFTELQISVGTQTDCSAPFPQAMVSPLRQFQFSIPTVFPPGSLLSRSSPMRTLLMPLGMICFQAVHDSSETCTVMQKHIFSNIIILPL